MKIIYVLISAFFFTFGCTLENNKSDQHKIIISNHIPKSDSLVKDTIELKNNCPEFEVLYPKKRLTLYKKKDYTFHLIKFFETTENKIEVSFFSIIPQKEFKPLFQNLDKKEIYSIQEFNSLKNNYEVDYSWNPYKKNDVFFIQVKPTKEMLKETLDIDLRNEIEGLISKEFRKTKVADFFAADLGPGGLNMLCSYKDELVAMNAILKVLCENNLENHTLISKRISIAKDDWIYEVVYPYNYTGEFDEM
jgi:hypothetical protein